MSIPSPVVPSQAVLLPSGVFTLGSSSPFARLLLLQAAVPMIPTGVLGQAGAWLREGPAWVRGADVQVSAELPPALHTRPLLSLQGQAEEQQPPSVH